MSDDFGIALFPQHAALLAASGITPEHARRRGYVSVDTKTRLEGLGIAPAGRRVPGLLVPSLRADGSVWGYQYRPDHPRDRNGKTVKYETPVGQRNGLDFPPGIADSLDDPSVPLWVTEGVKKGDAGALAGLCIVALPGVWSWLGTNPKGGKVAIADWRDIALNDRRVVLAFDSDVVVKPSVRKALDALADYLSTKGAKVEYLHLPNEDAGKTGIDDYLEDGHTVDDLVHLVRPDAPAVADEPAPVPPVEPDAPVTGRGVPLSGAAVLHGVRQWFDRYICTVQEWDLDLLTLWCAHTYLVMETYTTPRLILDSPVPGSGKTTTLEHLERLSFNAVQMASLSSPALLTRMLDAGMRTMLIDEADRTLNPDREGVGELMAILNSGYKRGGHRPVLVPAKEGTWKVAVMPTFCPVAMAGNSPHLPDDTNSRALRVLLMPDIDGTAEESDWELLDDSARKLGEVLALWADSVRDCVRVNRPKLPEGLRGRARERWAPLKRIADAAGDHWPALVDEMAAEDLRRQESEREEGIMIQKPHVVLLGHVHQAWRDGETFVSTEDLINRLVDKNPEMWGTLSTFGKRLTPQRLGRMMVKHYNVTTTRPERDGPRGYLRSSLAVAFRRFGLDPSLEPAHVAQPAQPAHDDPSAPQACSSCSKPMAPALSANGYAAHPSCGGTPA